MYAAPERLMVDQMITHIGGMELRRRKGPTQTNRVMLASIGVGQACVTLGRRRTSQRDYPLLLGPPLQGLEAIRKDKGASALERRQARMLELGALMIQSRNFPTQISSIKRQLERETAGQIRGTLKAIAGLRGKEGERYRGGLYGGLADLTAVALLNYGDNAHFGVLSPPHHEKMRDPKRNHDVIFGHKAELDEDATQALQVKLACGGYCPGGKTPDSDPRVKYTPEIALISGHCDLGLERRRFRTNLIDLSIPELLVKAEFAPEDVWSGERRTLRNMSESLVHTIVQEGDGERAGTAR